MNTFEVYYEGNLRTKAVHLDSGETIITDAPKDNHGLGANFSPTDLVCTALASCVLTIMAIAVAKNGIDIKGTKVDVKKTMQPSPRMIAQIDVLIKFPKDYDSKIKRILEHAANSCPVHRSLSDKTNINFEFIYR